MGSLHFKNHYKTPDVQNILARFKMSRKHPLLLNPIMKTLSIKNKNIAVLYGGDSSEYAVSVKSASVVIDELRKTGASVYAVHQQGTDWYCEIAGTRAEVDKNTFSVNTGTSRVYFDAAFIMIHGTPGEDGKIQGFFDVTGVKYSSCGQIAAALTFDKMACSSLLKRFGITMAEACYLNKDDRWDTEVVIQKTGLPCFVKPNRAGSSFGITKVKEASQLNQAIKHAFTFDNKVIIEQFVEGREITCGVHDLNGVPTTLPLTEIISKNEFFDYNAKYEGASEEITPAQVSGNIAEVIQAQSREIYNILDLRGVARVDYIVKNGVPYFIEVNTVPGMSRQSIVPQQITASGEGLSSFFERWVMRVLNKH